MNSGQVKLIMLNETGDIIFKKLQVYTLKWNYFISGQTDLRSNDSTLYIVHSPKKMHFLLNLEKFKFTWKYT
jgi:hypothetical protein